MDIIREQGGIRLRDVDSFNPTHIFECGQAFRWKPDRAGYIGVVGDRVIRVVQEDGDIVLENVSLEDYNNIWKNYFDLDRNYSIIKRQLKLSDSIMAEAISFGYGIRILNQDPWETLISFIISANNNIARIGTTIDNICRIYGESITWKDHKYYTFPSPKVLAQSDTQTLRKCGTGYRDRYIIETARMVAEDVEHFYSLVTASYDEAFNYLLKLPGVGPKVADCICLFSLKKHEAFPVDVWIKRIMETLYMDGAEIAKKDVKQMARGKFKDLAGFAQQYLFYYARENNIGK